MIEYRCQTDPPAVWDIMACAHGALAFDVGANIGQSTSVLAKGFDRVIALEPHPDSFAVLCKEMPSNVVSLQLAASDSDGEVQLLIQAGQQIRGMYASTEQPSMGPVVDTATMPAITLNALAIDHGMPDFVKIDTEGHEPQVIEGAKDLIVDCVPEWMIEVHSQEHDQLIRDAFDGYDIARFDHPNYASGSWGATNHFYLYMRYL